MTKKTFRYALITEQEEIYRLWCSCFPEDADGYCEFFLKRWFAPEHCVILKNEMEIESAAFLFEGELRGISADTGSFLYLYAISTAPRYRRQGNLKQMLEECRTLAKHKGFSGIFLTSAEGLESLYEQYGCKRCGDLYEVCFYPQKYIGQLSWKNCSYERYVKLRTKYLDEMPAAFHWTSDSDRFFYEDVWTKGKVIFCIENDAEYYAVCTLEEDGWMIRETNHLLTEDWMNCLGSELHVMDRLKILTPTTVWGGRAVCYGHWMGTDGTGRIQGIDRAYINIIAD